MYPPAFLNSPALLHTPRIPTFSKRPISQHKTPKMHSQPSPPPADFDRDYFEDLKAQYGHLPNVRIFARTDYELPISETPWLHVNRGRDLNAVRKDMTDRPDLPEELTDIPSRAFRKSDLHTDEEIADFEQVCRESDAVSGSFWDDPMPDSDFELDERWIDLRKIDDDQMRAVREAGEEVFESAERQVLKRKQYSSEAEEVEALKDSLDRMQDDNLDQPIPIIAFDENTPLPDAADFDKWQKAAEARGGNATKYESNFLSPVRRLTPDAENRYHPHTDAPEPVVPRQHGVLVETHGGLWSGELCVYDILPEREFDVRLERRLSVTSEVAHDEGDGLFWTTTVNDEFEDVISALVFSTADCEDTLLPGRGVSADGHYVTKPSRGTEAVEGSGFSVGKKFLQNVSDDRKCRGILELCMVMRDGDAPTRVRVFLTASGKDKVSTESKTEAEEFSKIIVLSERPQRSTPSQRDQANVREKCGDGLPTAQVKDLLGTWNGDGVMLHPEYPPFPYKDLSTSWALTKPKQTITQEHVSWVEDTLEDPPDAPSKRRQKTVAKKKLSKRVLAAKAHDERRLSQCSLLLHEQNGPDAGQDAFAWKAIPSEESFSRLYSPRLGRFVQDYTGFVVSDSLLLTFPFRKAVPQMWNTVELIEMRTPTRNRISAGRNERGDLVGVLFVHEKVVEGEASDSVASYV